MVVSGDPAAIDSERLNMEFILMAYVQEIGWDK